MSAGDGKFAAKRGKDKWSKSKSRGGEENGAPKPVGKYAELFLGMRDEMDSKNDQHERLVKLSRDCTIQSKRAIFTLHQFSGDEGGRDKILGEAEAKITQDVLPILRNIAREIQNTPLHKYQRAYTIGVQEFIEALAYYTYLKSGRLISFSEAQSFLTFKLKDKEDTEVEEKTDKPKEDEKASPEPMEVPKDTMVLPLDLYDFVLGLADLTGELMRLCINAVGSGNRELPFILLPFFRALFCGFHFFGPELKYMNQKMAVLRSSIGKVENVCYTLKVRGSEMPKQMLMDVINTSSVRDEDS